MLIYQHFNNLIQELALLQLALLKLNHKQALQ